MQELLQHIISPFIESPESVEIDIQEAPSSHIISIKVSDSDREKLEAEDGTPIQSIRHIMSIASGAKKAILRIASASDVAETEEAAETEDTVETAETVESPE